MRHLSLQKIVCHSGSFGLFLALLILPLAVRANHFRGGTVTWTPVASGTVEFHVVLAPIGRVRDQFRDIFWLREVQRRIEKSERRRLRRYRGDPRARKGEWRSTVLVNRLVPSSYLNSDADVQVELSDFATLAAIRSSAGPQLTVRSKKRRLL